MSVGTPRTQEMLSSIASRPHVPRVFGLVLVLTAWMVIAVNYPEGLMPMPHEAAESVYEIFAAGVLVPNLWATIRRAIFGFAGAMILGVTLGTLAGLSHYGRNFFTPYIIVGLSVPGVAWAAIMALVIGFNNYAPIAAAVLTVFPYVAINVWKGVENINMDLVEMAESFELSPVRVLYRIVVPNIAPSLFSASRFGLAITWRIVVITEIFTVGDGIGIRLILAYESFRFAEAWAWALVFMMIILAVEYGVFRVLEKRVYRYRAAVHETTV